MKKFHVERLLKLVDKLRTIPTEEFDMGSWWVDDHLSGCGTTACALGWAGTVPSFRRRGLCTNKKIGAVTFRPDMEADKKSVITANDSWRTNHLSGYTVAFGAAEAFFGLTHDETKFIFSSYIGNLTLDEVTGKILLTVEKYFPYLVHETK